MFKKLNEKFETIVSSIRGRAVISEEDLNVVLRQIRIALLEADVALVVVKNFIDNIKTNIIGQEILKSIKPDQMIIKLVQDELIKILGDNNEELNIEKKGLTKILFCGLQGSGKTTTIAKLANFIKKTSKKKIILASADIYRPAAQEQLKVLSSQIEVDFHEINTAESVKEITLESISFAEKNLYDVLLFDTAGRQVIDEKMMEELKLIHQSLNPHETMLVADSLSGQDAANVAKNFSEAIPVTSSILTRIDGDGRGGAALSIKSITGSPIKFLGTGEKIDSIEPFYPDRIASRILGMGDMVTLVEKAKETVETEDAKKLEAKIRAGGFDLDDYADQLRQMQKMGGMQSIMGMMPGMGKLAGQAKEAGFDDKIIKRQIALIQSMTIFFMSSGGTVPSSSSDKSAGDTPELE